MSEKPHCVCKAIDRRLFQAAQLCCERLRTLIKSSDNSLEKFWRLTPALRVLYSVQARDGKAMKMQGTMGVCTVEAGKCIQ